MTITDAIQLGDMPLFGDVRHPRTKPKRTCACGTILSQHNPDPICFPCQGRIRERGLSYAPYDPHPQSHQYVAALQVMQALPGEFTSYDVAERMQKPVQAASNWCVKARKAGLVEQLPLANGTYGARRYRWVRR